MFKFRILASLAALAVALLVVGLFPNGHAFAATRSARQATNVLTFNITIQGNIDQAVTFTLPAQLYLVPTLSPGSSHPFDACLDVGSQIAPYSNPVT